MELERFRNRRSTLPPWALVGEGVLAGLAGTAVMTAAQTRLVPRLPIPEGPQPRKKPEYPPEPEAKGEPATETTARRIARGLGRRSLSKAQKKQAGNLVHFGVGAVWGGLLSLVLPRPTIGQGLAFGALVWAVNDNGILPLLRIASWPNRYPPGVHVKALLAHLAYGAGTAWALRRVVGATTR